MGQGVSSPAAWEGDWQLEQREAENGSASQEIHKIRVNASPDRITLELHIASYHGLLCGELSDDWQEAPPAAVGFAELVLKSSGKSLGQKLSWRNRWTKEPSSLTTEFRSSEGGPERETLMIERTLSSAAEMVVTLSLQGEQVTWGPVRSSFKKLPETASASAGPAPVAFLRAHGASLNTAEERISVLDKVAQLVTENMDAISEAHAVDRVVPNRFNGTGQLILGGIASYKELIPKWMEPELLPDMAPAAVKAGVETNWTVYNEPKGVCINIAPWNAPVTLCIIPALSMLAAGNRVVIKPPDIVPNISALLRRLCQKYLDGYVWVEEGGKETVERIIDEGADHLEFTGGGKIGSVVAARCAKTLTPVTLELGGKSPVFVDRLSGPMLDDAVRELLETKVFKTGQFCCAHDYALVHEAVYSDFCAKLKAELEKLGPKRHVPMIGRRQYEVMKGLLKANAGVECIPPLEGDFVPNDEAMTIPMTGLMSPSLDNVILNEEIFGPLLPIVRVSSVQEAIGIINRPTSCKPLISYCYTEDPEAEKAFVGGVSAGNIAVNGGPARMLGNYAASFGGVGPSGMGVGFWGRDALREFSNRKHVMSAQKGFAKSFFSGPPPAK